MFRTPLRKCLTPEDVALGPSQSPLLSERTRPWSDECHLAYTHRRQALRSTHENPRYQHFPRLETSLSLLVDRRRWHVVGWNRYFVHLRPSWDTCGVSVPRSPGMVKGPADDSAGTHKRDKSCHTTQLKSDVRPRESRLIADHDQSGPWMTENHARECRSEHEVLYRVG